MKNFTYYRPKTMDQALALLDNKWGTAELLAGGTDLHDLQKEYIAQPDKLISMGGVDGLSGIQLTRGGYRIGPGTKLADIAAHKELREQFPALTEAAGQIGGPQIRNMGTLGGNLCQRNRCWYFRDEHVNCLLKGGDKCFAVNGENRYHAVFTKGHKCVIVNPSTLAPALMVLRAYAGVRGPKGSRNVELDQFFHAPSGPSEREHVLAPNEIIEWVMIPTLPGRNASYEVRHKQSYDWPLVQAAVALGKLGVRIVLGHVGPTPVVASEAAASILHYDKPITEEMATAAGVLAAKGASPLSQNEYKVKLIAVAVKRALLTAAGAKKYWEA